MLLVRRAQERGRSKYSWLDSYHTFSFADYYDPEQMGVSSLRVLNEDTVAPGAGFGTHGHRDMEIVSYVLDGALEHKDSMGNGSVIRPGDVQRMSAGSGIMHSEFNHSQEAPVHFLQIWLKPNRTGIQPGYAQKHFAPDDRRGCLTLLVSQDGRNGSIDAHQDALLYGTLLDAGDGVLHRLDRRRRAYVQVARGSLALNGEALSTGDGAIVSGTDSIELKGIDAAEALLFDLP